MRTILILCIAVFLSSCATDFVKEKNCSPRALNFLNSPNDNTAPARKAPALTEAQKNENSNKLKEIFSNYEPDLKKCYQEKVIDKGNIDFFNVCVVVGLDINGKQSFIDIDDHSKKLNQDLYQCILDKVNNENFLSFKGHTYIIFQPLKFYPRRM